MKTFIFLITVSFSVLISSYCRDIQNVPESNVSWHVYCATYNVDTNKPTEEQENYFLDCWCGSVEEEKALNSIK